MTGIHQALTASLEEGGLRGAAIPVGTPASGVVPQLLDQDGLDEERFLAGLAGRLGLEWMEMPAPDTAEAPLLKRLEKQGFITPLAADSEPVWVLKAPYVVGTEWSTVTVPYLLQRKNEYPRDLKYSHKTLMTWRIEAVDEAVTLSDGTEHQPCLRVVGQALLNLYTDPVRGFTDLPLISREWYCKGEGLVKFEREELVPPGYFTGGKLLAEQQR